MKLETLKKGYAQLNAGVWVGDIPSPLLDGIRLKVRRLWNPDYRVLYDKLREEGSDLSEAANEERITTTCLVETCLVDWDGIDDPFSVELAKELLSDEAAGPAFRAALLWAATRASAVVKAQLEQDSGN